MRFDERRVETHAVGAGIDVGAGLLQDRLGLGVQNIDADLLAARSARPDESNRPRRARRARRAESEARAAGRRRARAALADRGAARSLLPRSAACRSCGEVSGESSGSWIGLRRLSAIAGRLRENGIATCQFARRARTRPLAARILALGRAFRFARLSAAGKAGYQPRAEERDRFVAEVLGMGGRVIAVALVEPDSNGRTSRPALISS